MATKKTPNKNLEVKQTLQRPRQLHRLWFQQGADTKALEV